MNIRRSTPATVAEPNYDNVHHPQIVENGPWVYLSNKIRIVLSKRETVVVLSDSFTTIKLLAEVANALGLFFGLSVITLYDALESACAQSFQHSAG
jgi:hypothetical protein